jgi:hypothetical protein
VRPWQHIRSLTRHQAAPPVDQVVRGTDPSAPTGTGDSGGDTLRGIWDDIVVPHSAITVPGPLDPFHDSLSLACKRSGAA